MTPGSSRTQASISASAAISPPESTKSPIETSSRSRAAITRSSTPSNRPQTMIGPGPAASSATRPCVNGAPARAHQQARPARRRRRRSRAPARRPSSPCRARRRPACRRRCGACRSRDRGCRSRRAPRRPLASALPARLRAERPREHLGEDREHGRAPHGSGLRRRRRRTIRRPAISIVGTVVALNGSITVAPPAAGSISSRSPAPKLCTALTMPKAAPSAVSAASPIRSA